MKSEDFEIIGRYTTHIQLLQRYYKNTNDAVALEAIEKYKKEMRTALMFERMKTYAERRLYASAYKNQLHRA